jgi:WD40 repeat protein
LSLEISKKLILIAIKLQLKCNTVAIMNFLNFICVTKSNYAQMKKFHRIYGLLLFTAFACQENDDPIVEPITFESTESEWIRIVTTSESGNLGLMNPVTGTSRNLNVTPVAAGSRLYLSSSGRYITSVMRNEGEVRFFDTGIEFHIDHGHEYEPKWINGVAMAPLPTHFSTTQENIVIFNDGDGSISWAHEQSMAIPSFTPKIIGGLGNSVHHGAATWLEGDLIAVTFKNPAIPGALPQTVKLIDSKGKIIAESTTAVVTGIHGDASNGKYAIFGGMEGVLAASKNKELFLIPNNAGLNAGSGNWLGTIKSHDKSDVFYGSARNLGIFRVDPISKTISNVYAGNDVASYFFSSDGSKLIIQNRSNKVIVLHSDSGNEITSSTLSIAIDSNADARKSLTDLEMYRILNEPSPVLTASEKYLYILDVSRTNINILSLEDMSSVKAMKLDSPVANIMRIGFHEER